MYNEKISKNHKLVAIAFLMAALTPTCKSDDPMYYPGIISMSIAGFAREDVQVDQLMREISIAMPATITSTELKPTFRLTQGAKITGGLTKNGTLDLSNYCPCLFGSFPGSPLPTLTLELKTDKVSLSGEYRIRLKAKAPLVIKSVPKGSYSIRDESVYNVIVPVENYYGSTAISKVTIRDSNTGKVEASTSADGACMNDCTPIGINQMKIFLNFFPPAYKAYGVGPGSYIVELTLFDGTVVKTPRAIQVVP